jgi:glycerophosphoryl diester phosphodiesterase
MIQGLNLSTGRDTGIYPEIKQPAFHRQEGKDISTRVVEVLKEYGYTSKDSKVFLQTFDYEELALIQKEIFPSVGIEVNLIMLLGNRTDYPWMFEPDGMSKLAYSADGIGPSYNLVVDRASTAGDLRFSELVTQAHGAGLAVHPYTFRADPKALKNCWIFIIFRRMLMACSQIFLTAPYSFCSHGDRLLPGQYPAGHSRILRAAGPLWAVSQKRGRGAIRLARQSVCHRCT